MLVTGRVNNGTFTNSAELYDPSTSVWSNTGIMNYGRDYHSASVLTNGKVLVTGGYNIINSYLNITALYDPSTGVWTITGSMNYARCIHKASVLTNGQVLVAGGANSGGYLNSSELYQP